MTEDGDLRAILYRTSRNRGELIAACELLGLPPESTTRAQFAAVALTKPRLARCHNGHDMLDPMNVQVYVGKDRHSARGWRIQFKCRLCRQKENSAAARRERQQATRCCQQCGTMATLRGRSRFCSPACRRTWLAASGRKTCHQEPNAPTPAQVEQMLELQAELERETRAWLRPEIQARIDALKQARK